MHHIWVICAPYGPEDIYSFALAEDGEVIDAHISSNLAWAEHDMIRSGRKDVSYQRKYPDGFDVIWVGMSESDAFPGLAKALDANKISREAAEI